MNPQEIQTQREELKKQAKDWLIVTLQPVFMKYPIAQSVKFFRYLDKGQQSYLCRDMDYLQINDLSLEDWYENNTETNYELACAAADEAAEILAGPDDSFFVDTFGNDFYVTITSTEITCKPYLL